MVAFDEMLNPIKDTAIATTQKVNETTDKITAKANAVPNIPVIQDLKLGKGTLIGTIILVTLVFIMAVFLK